MDWHYSVRSRLADSNEYVSIPFTLSCTTQAPLIILANSQFFRRALRVKPKHGGYDPKRDREAFGPRCVCATKMPYQYHSMLSHNSHILWLSINLIENFGLYMIPLEGTLPSEVGYLSNLGSCTLSCVKGKCCSNESHISMLLAMPVKDPC